MNRSSHLDAANSLCPLTNTKSPCTFRSPSSTATPSAKLRLEHTIEPTVISVSLSSYRVQLRTKSRLVPAMRPPAADARSPPTSVIVRQMKLRKSIGIGEKGRLATLSWLPRHGRAQQRMLSHDVSPRDLPTCVLYLLTCADVDADTSSAMFALRNGGHASVPNTMSNDSSSVPTRLSTERHLRIQLFMQLVSRLCANKFSSITNVFTLVGSRSVAASGVKSATIGCHTTSTNAVSANCKLVRDVDTTDCED